MGLLGKALAGAGGAVQPVLMEGLRASIMAERDARLQQYQVGQTSADQQFRTSERMAGQEFTGTQNELSRQAEMDREKARLAERAQEHKDKVSMAKNTSKNIITNDAGEMFSFNEDKSLSPIVDPRTGEPMKSPKDLSAGSKAYLGVLSEQAKAINADPMKLPEEKAAELKPINDRIESIINGPKVIEPPPEAIKALQDNPSLADDFKKKYGKDMYWKHKPTSSPNNTAVTDFINNRNAQ